MFHFKLPLSLSLQKKNVLFHVLFRSFIPPFGVRRSLSSHGGNPHVPSRNPVPLKHLSYHGMNRKPKQKIPPGVCSALNAQWY